MNRFSLQGPALLLAACLLGSAASAPTAPTLPPPRAPDHPEGVVIFENHTALDFARQRASGWVSAPARRLPAGQWEPAGLGRQERRPMFAEVIYKTDDAQRACAFTVTRNLTSEAGDCTVEPAAQTVGDLYCTADVEHLDRKTCDFTIRFSIR